MAHYTSWFGYCWSERFSSCRRGFLNPWVNIFKSWLFVTAYFVVLLMDSSVWERSSALFFIVCDFCPGGPSPPKFIHDEEGCADFFVFPLCSALVFLEWPFHILVFSWPCRFCQTRTCVMVFLMDVLLFPCSGESVLLVKRSGWYIATRLSPTAAVKGEQGGCCWSLSWNL